jgi:phage gpG-like protein
VLDLDVDLDIEDLIEGFDAMKRKAANLSPVWSQLTPVLKADIRAHFDLREGPDGPWKPLAASTVAKRRQDATRRGKGRRTKSGRKSRAVAQPLNRLRTSFVVRHGRDYLQAISKVPWSGAHQDGATVGRGSVLPARPHIYGSEQFLDITRSRILDFVGRAW